MSGQYSTVYSNAMGGLRGQFNSQQGPSQQMQHPHASQILTQLQMTNNVNAGVSGGVSGMTAPGNMMNVNFSQGGIIAPHQQVSMQGMPTTVNVMSGGVMSTVGLQSTPHVQQQHMHLQQQSQSPQMNIMSQTGHLPGAGMASQQHMMHNVNISQSSQSLTHLHGGAANMGHMGQQQQNTSMVGGHQSQQPSLVYTSQANVSMSGGNGPPNSSQQSTSNNMFSISQHPHKEINIVTLSRVGQETVQDITSRFQEIFAALKIIQPTANRDNNTVKKVQEHFRTIRLLFKRMRLIYERCHDAYPQGKQDISKKSGDYYNYFFFILLINIVKLLNRYRVYYSGKTNTI